MGGEMAASQPGREARIAAIVAQLGPIGSPEALASSFEREADRSDPMVVEAYIRTWERVALRPSRARIRRLRRRAPIGLVRRRVRGPG